MGDRVAAAAAAATAAVNDVISAAPDIITMTIVTSTMTTLPTSVS